MVILTDNISVSDRLINSSIGKVKHLDRRSKPLCSTIYMKFDPLKKGKSTVIAERKQYLAMQLLSISLKKYPG